MQNIILSLLTAVTLCSGAQAGEKLPSDFITADKVSNAPAPKAIPSNSIDEEVVPEIKQRKSGTCVFTAVYKTRQSASAARSRLIKAFKAANMHPRLIPNKNGEPNTRVCILYTGKIHIYDLPAFDESDIEQLSGIQEMMTFTALMMSDSNLKRLHVLKVKRDDCTIPRIYYVSPSGMTLRRRTFESQQELEVKDNLRKKLLTMNIPNMFSVYPNSEESDETGIKCGITYVYDRDLRIEDVSHITMHDLKMKGNPIVYKYTPAGEPKLVYYFEKSPTKPNKISLGELRKTH